MADLEAKLAAVGRQARRAVVVTDGIFSMRGDHAPLPKILEIAARFDERLPGERRWSWSTTRTASAPSATTGRGTEEFTGSRPADILIGTLGKALGVNGGYVTGSRMLTDYLRETAPLYIYSNPITLGEARGRAKALEILDSAEGRELLAHLRAMTRALRGRPDRGLGYETLPGEHPVVPLMVRDTPKTNALVAHLRQHGILATGLKFPVVPQGRRGDPLPDLRRPHRRPTSTSSSTYWRGSRARGHESPGDVVAAARRSRGRFMSPTGPR